MNRAKKIGMVGFGRFSRTFLRQLNGNKDIDVMGICDAQDAELIEHLFKYDSVYGKLESAANISDNKLIYRNQEISLFLGKTTATPSWKEMGVDTVFFDGTAKSVSKEEIAQHQAQGAQKILVAGEITGMNAVKYCPGISDDARVRDANVVQMISPEAIASSLAIKTLHEKLGVERATLTHISAYSSNQSLADVQNKDFRMSRAAGVNVVPVETNLAEITGGILPELSNKLMGLKCYVPVSSTSCLDITLESRTEPTVDDIIQAFDHNGHGIFKGLVDTCELPLVSTDFICNPMSFTLDTQSVSILDGRLVHLMGWFDETSSYATRCIEFLSK